MLQAADLGNPLLVFIHVFLRSKVLLDMKHRTLPLPIFAPIILTVFICDD